MKVKNIAFSGFMAAIMLSATGAANAAVEIASKGYVDQQRDAAVTTAATNVTNELKNYTTTEKLGDVINNNITNILNDTTTEGGLGKTVNDLQTSVDALETTVGDETAGLVKDVADAAATATAAGTAAENAQKDVDALEGVVNSTTDGLATKASAADVTALTSRVSTNETNIAKKADKVTVAEGQAGNIATVNASGQYEVSTVKATDLVTNETVTEKITTALEGNESVKEIITNIVGDGTVVTEAIDKSVNSGTLKTELDKKADKETTYTKEETNTAISDYAIPRPDANCTATSGRCVLSVDTDGNFIWVDVTSPVDGEGE